MPRQMPLLRGECPMFESSPSKRYRRPTGHTDPFRRLQQIFPVALSDRDAILSTLRFDAPFGFTRHEDFVEARSGGRRFHYLHQLLHPRREFFHRYEPCDIDREEELAYAHRLPAETDAANLGGHRPASEHGA